MSVLIYVVLKVTPELIAVVQSLVVVIAIML